MRAETRGEPRTTVPTATGGSGSGGGETPTVAKEEVAEEGVAVSSGGLESGLGSPIRASSAKMFRSITLRSACRAKDGSPSASRPARIASSLAKRPYKP